jgi:hypothetical protein
MSFFAGERPIGGERSVTLRLPGLEIELTGLPDGLATTLLDRFTPFVVDGRGGEPDLRVRVGLEDRDYFIDPPATPELNPIRIACDGTLVRYLGYRVAGWFDTRAGGEGRLLLARGTYEPPERAVENYVRASVAWQAAAAGGALVHGASAVLGDRGYLFFGPSGAGKSTLCASNRRGRILSDDLSVVLPGPGGGPELVGSPFRGTYEGGPPIQGRFRLHAAFRLVQADKAEVRPVPRVRGFGELVGNLPFVAEAFGDRPELFESVERAFETVPIRHLRFRKDDSFWDAVRSADL